jgi:hypothetical protein
VGHFRFEATPSLVGGLILDISMRIYVLDVVSQLGASSHNLCGSEFACSMQDAISFKDQFFRSTTLFRCGV